MSPKIFVVVPVYNESEEFEKVLASLMGFKYHIMVVDDGSDNDVETTAIKYSVIFLRHIFNCGQGAALLTGMKEAQNLDADIVVHFDADGQHDAGDIPKLIEPLLEGQYDIVFGSRFMKEKNILPVGKKIILQLGRYMNWFLYGILLTDAHNGLRAMNKKAIQKMNITQNRMAHASEILYLVKKNSLKYMEVPVRIHYTEYSKKKGQSIFNAINIFFDLIFKK